MAQEILGWHPTVQLDEGLKRTIVYFDEVLKAPDIRADSLAC